jgi:starch synthase
VEYWGKLSFLKAGIRFSDCVSTVSRNYAHEIMTPRFGCGMDGILSFRKLDLRAIPNAIDAACGTRPMMRSSPATSASAT